MRGLGLSCVAFLFSCSAADFEVSNATDDAAVSDTAADAGGSDDAMESDAIVSVDAPVPMDAGCAPVAHDTIDVWVDINAPAGGKGTSRCPFQTLKQAASASLGAGVTRVVHVLPGSYNETSIIRIRGGETYRGEGGVPKLYPGVAGTCAPTAETCGVLIDGGGTIDGIWIEAGAVSHGIVTYTTSGTVPAIRNTVVRAARKDGVVVMGTGASIGPKTTINANGYSGLVMRGTGRLDVTGGGNSFDNNLGGKYIGGTFVNGAGILMNNGQLFLDGGATANNNHIGVQFDWYGYSGVEQIVSQLTAQGNRNDGVVVAKGWTKFTLRKSTLTKNVYYGLFVEWNTGRSNAFDIGRAGFPGNNILGGATNKNGKAAVFLCGSGPTGSYSGEVDSFSVCPPQQLAVSPTCDSVPASYVDVAYVPHSSVGTTAGLNPLASPGTCAVGP
jgi:hypothetical protein